VDVISDVGDVIKGGEFKHAPLVAARHDDKFVAVVTSGSDGNNVDAVSGGAADACLKFLSVLRFRAAQQQQRPPSGRISASRGLEVESGSLRDGGGGEGFLATLELHGINGGIEADV